MWVKRCLIQTDLLYIVTRKEQVCKYSLVTRILKFHQTRTCRFHDQISNGILRCFHGKIASSYNVMNNGINHPIHCIGGDPWGAGSGGGVRKMYNQRCVLLEQLSQRNFIIFHFITLSLIVCSNFITFSMHVAIVLFRYMIYILLNNNLVP